MPDRTERQKTNSITHLVKIVAREEIDKQFKNLEHAMKFIAREELAAQLEVSQTVITGCADDMLKGIQSSLEQAGRLWEKQEDELLVQEVNVAIAQIAKNHGRSIVSIRYRLRDKEILGS